MSTIETHRTKPDLENAVGSQSGWLPIETAPRDGTRVLLFWVGPDTRRLLRTPEICLAEVYSHKDGVTAVWNGTDKMPLHFFTHWMPLPEPPK